MSQNATNQTSYIKASKGLIELIMNVWMTYQIKLEVGFGFAEQDPCNRKRQQQKTRCTKEQSWDAHYKTTKITWIDFLLWSGWSSVLVLVTDWLMIESLGSKTDREIINYSIFIPLTHPTHTYLNSINGQFRSETNLAHALKKKNKV